MFRIKHLLPFKLKIIVQNYLLSITLKKGLIFRVIFII
jgi:hypothetical protein